jgi:hypothetical protein
VVVVVQDLLATTSITKASSGVHILLTQVMKSFMTTPAMSTTTTELGRQMHSQSIQTTAWHYDRTSVDIWSGGGLVSIAAACYALGLAAAASIIGIEVTPFLLGVGAMLSALGLATGWIVDVYIKDETGSGWSFVKIINSGDTSDTSAQGGFLKLGCMWWMRITDGYGNAVFTWVWNSDGHYIQ